jgi:phosphoserine phosphatase RsbU/P
LAFVLVLTPPTLALLGSSPVLAEGASRVLQSLAAQEPAITLTRGDLRWQIANIAAAVLILLVAAGAAALYFFRSKSRDPFLIFFGIFSAMYAVRLLALVPAFRALFSLPLEFWLAVNWDITAAILVPASLFFYQVVSEPVRRVLRWMIAVQAAFAVFGIAAAALGMNLATLNLANNAMVLGSFAAVGVIFLWRRALPGPRKPMPREMRVLLVGFLVWLAFIVRANLAGVGVLRGRNVEFLGFLVFVAALGYVAAYRTFANEERLLAIDKELEIARGIQASTLPHSVPQFAGLDIAARYVPMSAVAGDFYDFLLIDKLRVGVLIADVTGHGVPAALIASMLKVAFAAQAAHADDPARLLDGLNRALCGKFEEHFVTAAYVFIDLARGTMKYAGAAHPALMIVSGASGQAREVVENGLMLGMFTEATYSAVEISVGRGDRCLLCTDGILEARTTAGEEFGGARCAEVLKAQRTAPAAEAADALLASVTKFAGYNVSRGQDDDMTLLVIDLK